MNVNVSAAAHGVCVQVPIRGTYQRETAHRPSFFTWPSVQNHHTDASCLGTLRHAHHLRRSLLAVAGLLALGQHFLQHLDRAADAEQGLPQPDFLPGEFVQLAHDMGIRSKVTIHLFHHEDGNDIGR